MMIPGRDGWAGAGEQGAGLLGDTGHWCQDDSDNDDHYYHPDHDIVMMMIITWRTSASSLVHTHDQEPPHTSSQALACKPGNTRN